MNRPTCRNDAATRRSECIYLCGIILTCVLSLLFTVGGAVVYMASVVCYAVPGRLDPHILSSCRNDFLGLTVCCELPLIIPLIYGIRARPSGKGHPGIHLAVLTPGYLLPALWLLLR